MLGVSLLIAAATVATAPITPSSPMPTATAPELHRPRLSQPVSSRFPSPSVDAARTPAGFLQMFVATVMPTPDGHTVVLVSPEEEVLLPVGVALPEAVAIYGRLESKRSPRPLTHDLLDGVMSALGGEVVRVQIDDLVDGAFIGTVTIRRKGAVDVSLEARVADALAVALSAKAPIFVARPVVDRAALTHADLEKMPASAPSPPGADRVYDL